MALFQEEQVTQEQFDKKYNLNQPDIFSNLGYDDIINERREKRQKLIEDEKQWVSNIVSPDKINEWKNQGSMTAIEVWHKKNKNELVPYMGSWKEGTKSFDLKRISEKMQTGQVITPEERQKFQDFVLDLAEVQTRGYTFGGGAMNIGLETIPFMAEFGIGLLTSGGTASVGATASKLSTEALKKGIKQQIAEGVKKTVYNATLNPRTYAFTATRLPQQVRARMGDILLSDTVAVSPEGQAILKESEEKPAIAFMKALALTNIETASELSGAMLVRPTLNGIGQLSKVITAPIAKLFPKGFADSFVKLAEQTTKMPFASAVRNFGWDGMLEEMGEERVGDLLQFAFNLDGEDGYSFEQLLDALFPPPEQLLQEALAFGATGVAMHGMQKGLKSIPKVGEKYTKDGFLLDAGIFRMAGYDSYLDKKVKEELNKRGKSEEEIDDAIHFSTRDDKVQFLKETNVQFDSKKEYDAKEFEKELKRAEVEEKTFEKFTQGGKVENEQAFGLSKLFGQFYKKYASGSEKAKEKFDNWFNKFDVQYDVPSEQTKTLFQNDRYEWNPNLRKVQITDKTNAEVQLNNSIWVPTEIIAMEGASYGNQKIGVSFWLDFGRRNLKGYNVKELGDFPESEQQNTEKQEYNSELDKVALKHFGTTTNIKEAGYLLNNGKLLDFSGKKFGGQAGRRSIDHREINDAFLENEKFEDYGFDEFIDNGAIRVMPESGSFLIARMPSEKQFNELKRIINLFNGEVRLELVHNMAEWGNSDTTFSKDYEAFSKAEKILDDVRTFFKGGKISEFKTYFQSAYHGTPHRFDEFSTDYMGSGEGAQAHGWGLYFAEDKQISENYRKSLSGDNFDNEKYFYNGKEITDRTKKAILSTIVQYGKDEVIARREFYIDNYAFNKEEKNKKREELKYIKSLDESKIEKKTDKGQLFEVDIPDNDVLLDEDKKFSEQPEKVQEAIKKLAEDYNIQELKIESIKHFIKRVVDKFGKKAGDIVQEIYNAEIENNEYDAIETNKMVEDAWDKWNQFELDNNIDVNYDDFNINEIYSTIDKNITGKQIYKTLVSYSSEKLMTDSQREASILLNKYGIKGITYDGRQDGRCYVIFDDKAVDVLKTYYQDANEEDEKLIAGFTYPEVLDKLTGFYEQLGDEKYKLSKEEEKKLWAKVHVLEDAFEIAENPEKFSNEERRQDVMLNAYYIMNNQEIPEDYIETDSKSQRTYEDYVKLHKEKKEQKEAEYYGYFTEGTDKNIITIMSNSNASTALHELGHLFYNGLVELSNASEEAKTQLEAVNKQFNIVGEPTVQQLERFARSFEAYLYKGKAPNSTLRKVFENFKEWLKAVYHDITSLQNKGADISEEVQELFDKMFGDDEFYQEQKQANELLKKVKEVSATQMKKIRKDEEAKIDESNLKLTPEQKKYKDTAYDVLWYALSNSKIDHKPVLKDKRQLYMLLGNDHTVTKRNKGVMKQGEKLEQFLAELDDPFSAGDGFLSEWKDYFTDTITNDSDDSALAMQAYNVIVHQSYLKQNNMMNELDKRMEFFEKAVDDADREYKILIREYKNGNRNVALSAIYEWLEKLPSEIKQDYEDRFIYDSGVIDREENVDKFDKAKRQILSKALELDNQFGINNNEKYQETVKEIMRSLDFLQPDDKAKLTANILDVPSTSFLMSSIDNIMDIAKTMEDINLRRNLEREIHKELQGTKNVKKNGRSVGKYDYKTNKLFEELRDLDRLSPEKANELRLELGKFSTAEDNGLSFKDKLINKFLSYKAGGRTFADTELMKELYDSILKIKLAGKSAKSELDLMEKLDETKDVEELINIVQGKKEAGSLIKNYIDKVANLESTLNAIFNKDIKERYGSEILYAETQAQAWQHQQKQKFEKEVAKIYGLPEWCWDKKILEYLGEKHKYTEIRRKYDEKGELLKTRNVDRTLTKMDIIQAYIWSKNEVLEKRLMNQFGEDTLNAMFDELSLEDVKFAEAMMNLAQSFYPLVNKAFINKYGLDLPRVSCYFPSTPERGSEVDLYNDYSSKSMNNSFTKARAQSETQAMDFHNPVATLYNHIDGVSKFVFMSDSLDKANIRFKDLDLKRVIINKFGEDAYRTLEQALMNVTYKKEAPVFNGMNKIIDNMVGNWIQANVAVKPIVGLKQLLSANNYAVDMPYMTWQAGFLKALANPKETIDYMMSIPYLKARFEGNFSNEFLKAQIENSAFAMSKKLKDACTMFVKIGDIGAIIFGGKPYIDYLIKEKGMTEQEAIKQFILSTNRSQQSSAISSLSNFQVNMTRNPMGKLFIAFKNSPQQYIRMCGDAIVSVANGDMSKTQCAKMLFQYGYLQPFFYAVATSGSLLTYLFTGDDDDLIKDATISIFNFGSDALPIIGDIYKYALNRMVYKEKYLPQTTPLLGDIQQEINRISKDDVSLADYLEAIGYLGLHVGLGYNSKAFENMGSGVGDIATGDVGLGAMKVLGYTEKRSKHITGNEDKKKKK